MVTTAELDMRAALDTPAHRYGAALAVYLSDGESIGDALLCRACATRALYSDDSETRESVALGALLSWSDELDYPAGCDDCGAWIGHALTADGVRYSAELVARLLDESRELDALLLVELYSLPVSLDAARAVARVREESEYLRERFTNRTSSRAAAVERAAAAVSPDRDAAGIVGAAVLRAVVASRSALDSSELLDELDELGATDGAPAAVRAAALDSAAAMRAALRALSLPLQLDESGALPLSADDRLSLSAELGAVLSERRARVSVALSELAQQLDSQSR